MNSEPHEEHGQVDVDVLEILRETIVDSESHETLLRKTLCESLTSDNLERVKRTADAFHQAGGDPVSALASFAVDDSLSSDQRRMASRALEAIDSSAMRRIKDIRSVPSLDNSKTDPNGLRKVSQTDHAQKGLWIFLGILAILWPLYSVYRFNNPGRRHPEAPENDVPWTDQGVSLEARSACMMAVRQQLKDPDSADFPSLSPPTVDVSYSGAVDIRGYLHANNGLGLKVRVNYLCSVQADRRAHTLSALNAHLLQP